MNREFKRQQAREERRQREQTKAERAEQMQQAKGRERAGVGQFLRESRAELRKVDWPTRREVTNYSIVVLIAVSLVTAMIYGVDRVLREAMFTVFG